MTHGAVDAPFAAHFTEVSIRESASFQQWETINTFEVLLASRIADVRENDIDMANQNVLVQNKLDNFVDFRILVVGVEMVEQVGIAFQDRAEVLVRFFRTGVCRHLVSVDDARFIFDGSFVCTAGRAYFDLVPCAIKCRVGSISRTGGTSSCVLVESSICCNLLHRY